MFAQQRLSFTGNFAPLPPVKVKVREGCGEVNAAVAKEFVPDQRDAV